jgi:hypothetical protein
LERPKILFFQLKINHINTLNGVKSVNPFRASETIKPLINNNLD